jgi:phosphopantothenoylcysteine decarboxylase/phosphopantothenate--cysteine ligase
MNGKKILVGVTGGIAAYKVPLLVRLLVKSGAEVKVVSTESAFDFVTELTLSTVSKNSVISTFSDNAGNWNSHVDLGLWADAFVVSPATANSIGKMANGLCDNILLATYLSAKCPVVLAPAMDLDMLKHPAVQKNIETVKSFGNSIIEPNDGDLASGLVGKGRMAEPEEIFQFLNKLLNA